MKRSIWIIIGVVCLLLLFVLRISFNAPASKNVSVQPSIITEPPIPAPIQLAKEDLAKKLHTDPNHIDVVGHEHLVWSDESLGCPEEGKTYATKRIPGYESVFRYEGKQYEYHTDADQVFILCEEEDE